MRYAGDRSKGRSLLDGNINMYNTRVPADYMSDTKSEFDERSQLVHQGTRKRSPSDILRRKS